MTDTDMSLKGSCNEKLIVIMKTLTFITLNFGLVQNDCGCISALFFDISKIKITNITSGLKSKNKLAVHAV